MKLGLGFKGGILGAAAVAGERGRQRPGPHTAEGLARLGALPLQHRLRHRP